VKSQELIQFTKSLAVMLKSGIAINEALSSLADQARSNSFGEIIHKVRIDVEKGTTLTEAFSKEEGVFGKVFIGLLRAGEISGSLEGNLLFLASWLGRSNELKREVKAATLYPKIVLGATFLLGGTLGVFILPRLVPLFNSLSVELPLPTRALLFFTNFLQDFWFLALMIIVGVIAGLIYLNRITPVRRFFHLVYLKVPFFGTLMVEYQLALISQLFFYSF